MLNMHNEMWGMLMNVYLPGDAAQAQLQAEVKQNPASLKKMEWCQQWTNSKASFGLRLLAFAAVQVILPTAPGTSNEGGSSELLVPLPAVSWPWVPAWGSLEPPR